MPQKSSPRSPPASFLKLAVMSSLDQSTIDNIVRGISKDPCVKTFRKIAYAFNMTVSELQGNERGRI